MRRNVLFVWLYLCHIAAFAQIGIGTTSPNSKSILDISSHTKGLLVPRMTGAERVSLGLTGEEAGMTVYQTDITGPAPTLPKGLYTFDGTAWHAPMLNGSTNGETLRWDGSKWIATTNLFNQGGSIGIGTQSPKTQLHINSGQAVTNRIQFTNTTTGANAADGLVMGISYPYTDAHIIQQENKPLLFGTAGTERMRIDSAGNIGINRNHPTTALDVNGTVKTVGLTVTGTMSVASMEASSAITAPSLTVTGQAKIGANGTALNSIIRYTAMIDMPFMIANFECAYNVQIPNVLPGATVQVSPAESMSQIMIEYARVSAAGTVEIKFMNMALAIDPAPMNFYITVVQ